MTKRQATALKARIERETGDGPASIMFDTSGLRPSWIVGYSGRWYVEAGDWTSSAYQAAMQASKEA